MNPSMRVWGVMITVLYSVWDNVQAYYVFPEYMLMMYSQSIISLLPRASLWCIGSNCECQNWFQTFLLWAVLNPIWKLGMQDFSVWCQWPRINDNTIQKSITMARFWRSILSNKWLALLHGASAQQTRWWRPIPIYSAKPNFFVPTWSTRQVDKVQAPQTKYQWHKLTQSNLLQFVSRCMSTLIFFSMNQTTDQTHPYLNKSSAFTYRSSPNLHA